MTTLQQSGKKEISIRNMLDSDDKDKISSMIATEMVKQQHMKFIFPDQNIRSSMVNRLHSKESLKLETSYLLILDIDAVQEIIGHAKLENKANHKQNLDIKSSNPLMSVFKLFYDFDYKLPFFIGLSAAIRMSYII